MTMTSPLSSISPQEPRSAARDPAAGAGILAVAEAQRPQLDRVPALGPATEQLASALSARLAQLAGQEVGIRVDSIQQQDLADWLASLDASSVMAVFACQPEAGNGFIRIQDRLVRPLLDLALGGRRDSRPVASAARPLTAIEVRLTERLTRQMLVDLQAACAPSSALGFRFDRLDTKPRAARLPAGATAVLLVRLQVDLGGSESAIDVVLPGAAIDALRIAPAGAAAIGQGDGRSWADRLFGGLCEVDVEVEAVLHERMVDLSLARDLKVGETVALGIRPDTAIALRCGDVGVAMAAVACRDDQLVLSVEQRIIENGASA